jgi:hypothetical protein
MRNRYALGAPHAKSWTPVELPSTRENRVVNAIRRDEAGRMDTQNRYQQVGNSNLSRAFWG